MPRRHSVTPMSRFGRKCAPATVTCCPSKRCTRGVTVSVSRGGGCDDGSNCNGAIAVSSGPNVGPTTRAHGTDGDAQSRRSSLGPQDPRDLDRPTDVAVGVGRQLGETGAVREGEAERDQALGHRHAPGCEPVTCDRDRLPVPEIVVGRGRGGRHRRDRRVRVEREVDLLSLDVAGAVDPEVAACRRRPRSRPRGGRCRTSGAGPAS